MVYTWYAIYKFSPLFFELFIYLHAIRIFNKNIYVSEAVNITFRGNNFVVNVKTEIILYPKWEDYDYIGKEYMFFSKILLVKWSKYFQYFSFFRVFLDIFILSY